MTRRKRTGHVRESTATAMIQKSSYAVEFADSLAVTTSVIIVTTCAIWRLQQCLLQPVTLSIKAYFHYGCVLRRVALCKAL